MTWSCARRSRAIGGYVVKTTGDGFHAAFAAAHDALDAAVAAQLALVGESWGETGPLRVRMGVHSGPAELRDGDYYGTAVNRAARLMSAAHGGQIVVSLATEELVQESGVELLDLGEHVLKDLSRAERVFQVVHPELRRDFPVLRSLDAFPGNLPAQVTSFVGRDDDVAQIVEMLAEGAALVTLIGTGGVGKTRLAVQVAAEVLAQFRDGAWFCDLASARDGDAMAQVVATALGCVQRPGLSLADSIVEYAKVRELLVVLDNCEHLLDEAGALAEAMMQECPGGRLVATSREAFGVRGERVVRVRSLDAPDPSATGDALLESAAVRLFVDRAADAGADTTWNDAQWAAVGEICRRVDGIPLAIELAAARVASMRPTEIAAHLDERFRLLTGTRRGRVERHQTLRSTVEWSYQLLEADDRAVFDRLGVFAGTFDTAGASAVASDDDLDSLADRGFDRESGREVDAGRRRRRLTTRPATRCSKRCASSPGNVSKKLATRTDGVAATPSTTSRSRKLPGLVCEVPTRSSGWPVSSPSSTTCAPRSGGASIATIPSSANSRCGSSLRSPSPQ